MYKQTHVAATVLQKHARRFLVQRRLKRFGLVFPAKTDVQIIVNKAAVSSTLLEKFLTSKMNLCIDHLIPSLKQE